MIRASEPVLTGRHNTTLCCLATGAADSEWDTGTCDQTLDTGGGTVLQWPAAHWSCRGHGEGSTVQLLDWCPLLLAQFTRGVGPNTRAPQYNNSFVCALNKKQLTVIIYCWILICPPTVVTGVSGK